MFFFTFIGVVSRHVIELIAPCMYHEALEELYKNQHIEKR